MTTLYHGSFVSVESPLVGVGRRELDFGPGFYVTSLREQAERWARRVCVVRAVNTPVISIYQFDEESLPNDIRRIYLEHYDLRWLANDQVIDTVEDYYAGRITVEQAIGQLRFARPTHQMCIRNQIIVDNCLHFVNSEVVPKKGGEQ